MSVKACTLAAVRESLTPEQWARLERINPHLAAPVAKARERGELVEAHAHRDGDRVTLVAKGLRLDLTPNARLHPQVVARRRRREHQVVTTALQGIAPPAGPWRVTITRVGPRVLDDDNRTASAKGVRDALAAWLGVDDGSESVRWEVRGEVSRGYAVRVQIEGGE
jgi:hypothetical protein